MPSMREIRERLARATKGPWKIAERPEKGNDVKRIGPYVYSTYLGAVATTPKDSGVYSNLGNNLRFIASAPTDIAWLLEMLEKMRGITAWASAHVCRDITFLQAKGVTFEHLPAPCGKCTPCQARALLSKLEEG